MRSPPLSTPRSTGAAEPVSTIDAIVAAIRAHPRFDPACFDPAALAAALGDDMVRKMLDMIATEREAARFGRFGRLFPDDGALARHHYPRHLDFFRAGARYRERCFLAANRVGKTVGAAYETSCHLTGLYPGWWEGRRFAAPIRAWVAGATNETTRDIIQAELLGQIAYEGSRRTLDGSGIVPHAMLGEPSWKSGTQNLVDAIPVRHASGGWSQLALKSYEQGRKAFEGTSRELIWLDEEAGVDVYGECLIRTATTKGLLILTFTPLKGLSETVLQFLPTMRPGEM
jgi:phage terminase large subunit-like protein